MGVSVRMTRNTRVHLPFWLAIPVFACVVAGWVLILAVITIPWLVLQIVRLARR